MTNEITQADRELLAHMLIQDRAHVYADMVKRGDLNAEIVEVHTALRAIAAARRQGQHSAADGRVLELLDEIAFAQRALHSIVPTESQVDAHVATHNSLLRIERALAQQPGGRVAAAPCPHTNDDECDCPTPPGIDDEQSLDDLALRMANTYPMAAIIRALDKHAPGIRHAFAPPKSATPAAPEGMVLVHKSDLIEEDSYGVPGSAFYRCKLCGNESGAGILCIGIDHNEDCPLAAAGEGGA